MQDFIDTTKRYKKIKDDAGVWRGFKLEETKPRPKIHKPKYKVPSSGPDDRSLTVISNVENDGIHVYKTMTHHLSDTTDIFRVGTLRDLSIGEPAEPKLLVWLHAIAKGRKMVEKDHRSKERQLLPSLTSVDARVYFSKSFRKEHSQCDMGA